MVELGPGVTELAIGERVAMPWLGYACGICDYCVSGRETLCVPAEHGLLDRRRLRRIRDRLRALRVPVPDGVNPFDAAPLTARV